MEKRRNFKEALSNLRSYYELSDKIFHLFSRHTL